jgi:hypothetical protein
MGINRDVAGLYVEMYAAFDSGLLRPEGPATAEHRTKTTLEEFARSVLAPAFRGTRVSA